MKALTITQEVFLKIIRHDMRYQSMEHERAWIVRVTVNLCRDLLKSKWHKTSVSMEEVNVNQSRLHVNDRMYLSMLQDMLNKYNIPMNMVVFEITESAFIEDSKTMVGLINKMKALGFSFSMDDFGSGYSSFNLLKDMAADELKIDKEFLESTDDSKRSRYIIEKIVQMAHGLDIRVVCEGVERKEQVEFLREIECDIIQGYYYSKPMPMADYEKYLLQFDLKQA